MAKNDNLQDFLTDLAKAIRTRKRLTGKINPQDFSNEIISIAGDDGVAIINQEKSIEITKKGVTEITYDDGFTGLSKVVVNTNIVAYTGHADVEGLRAIGWTDEDIAYYQENGVKWNEEDDEYHKVTDDNKALYGVLTTDNISTYKDRIVYLPKIDTSGKTSMNKMFKDCYSLISIPLLNTSSVTDMNYMFQNCYSLVCIPPIDTQKVSNFGYMFNNCRSLISIHQIDAIKGSLLNTLFYNCNSLTHVNIKNVSVDANISVAQLISKDSLLYIINNEYTSRTNPPSSFSIKLNAYAYDKWSVDADVVAALEAHPNVSLTRTT